jgi:8-oxo-dGTP diphosphatase
MGKADQVVKSGQRYQAILRVLVFLRNDSDVLLLRGASNKRIWANLFNGVGGHVEVNEDVLSAAKREVQEETGLLIDSLDLRAVVNIDAGDRDLGILMFAFVGWTNNRQTVASREGALHWIPIDMIEEYPLVEDLYWLIPRIIGRNSSPPLYLHYGYDENDRLVILKSE